MTTTADWHDLVDTETLADHDVLALLLGPPGTWLQIHAGGVLATGRVSRVIADGGRLTWLELTDDTGDVTRIAWHRIDAIEPATR